MKHTEQQAVDKIDVIKGKLSVARILVVGI